mmetsp:Transcript_17368/g.43730  ORF Transcript_17368/g.43730 Transcript_17368/m.43730 type:complete len:258 (-) Transcript_17368:3246-4019(-)
MAPGGKAPSSVGSELATKEKLALVLPPTTASCTWAGPPRSAPSGFDGIVTSTSKFEHPLWSHAASACQDTLDTASVMDRSPAKRVAVTSATVVPTAACLSSSVIGVPDVSLSTVGGKAPEAAGSGIGSTVILSEAWGHPSTAVKQKLSVRFPSSHGPSAEKENVVSPFDESITTTCPCAPPAEAEMRADASSQSPTSTRGALPTVTTRVRPSGCRRDIGKKDETVGGPVMTGMNQKSKQASRLMSDTVVDTHMRARP